MSKNKYKEWLDLLENGINENSKNKVYLQFAILWFSFVSYQKWKFGKEDIVKFKNKYSYFYNELLREEEFEKKLLKFSKTKKGGRESVLNLRYDTKVDFDTTTDDIKDLYKFIKVIREIRNNFFHGNKRVSSEEDRKLVAWAYDTFLYFWERFIEQEL